MSTPLMSLWNMLRLHAEMLTDLAWGAGVYEGVSRTSVPMIPTAKSGPNQEWAERHRRLAAELSILGLPATAMAAIRMASLWEKEFEWAECQRLQSDLHSRLQDELGARLCFMLESDKARFYTQAHLFGEAVSNSFPSAILDIEEAGKCLALGRNTACVFHLMRVMETALRALGVSLNDPTLDPTTNPTWDRILSRGDKELAKRAVDRSPEWKAKPDFFAEAHATLRSVGTAWRNRAMHVGKTYDEERALDIFNAVKGFMRHLSTELREVP